MKIIAIGGAPGTGKTTLMKSFMKEIREWILDETVKLVPYHYSWNELKILGKYERGETFGGTDKMSMACQPEVIKWLNTLHDDTILLFEGDRLFNSSFLEYCDNNFDLYIIILETSNKERIRRYSERGSNQNETWLAGRVSKVNNIRNNLQFMDKVTVFDHSEPEDTKKILNNIMEKIQ